MTEVFKGTRVDNWFAFIYFHRQKQSILQVSLVSSYVKCNLLEHGIGKELLCCDSFIPSSLASIKRGSVGCSCVAVYSIFQVQDDCQLGGQANWLPDTQEEKTKSSAIGPVGLTMVNSKAKSDCVDICVNFGMWEWAFEVEYAALLKF